MDKLAKSLGHLEVLDIMMVRGACAHLSSAARDVARTRTGSDALPSQNAEGVIVMERNDKMVMSAGSGLIAEARTLLNLRGANINHIHRKVRSCA